MNIRDKTADFLELLQVALSGNNDVTGAYICSNAGLRLMLHMRQVYI